MSTAGTGQDNDTKDKGGDQAALELHQRVRGKIRTTAKIELSESTLELVYTPGVGAVSRRLAEDAASALELTGRGNAVAVISDGSAVLGLGDEGPLAALPVLEGKALLFRELAGIDAIPLALDTNGPDELIRTVRAVAPSFGAINLEDIAAPGCFEIERRLRQELQIPVVHDDQHGTAIVVLAALLNAAAVTGRELAQMRMVIVGAGAGGAATARLLNEYGTGGLVVVDSQGALGPGRDDLDPAKELLVEQLGLDGEGTLADVLDGADAIVGLSGQGAFSVEDVGLMAADPIVFALANPEPEVDPHEARKAGAAVVATGRSDFPNQVNNVLAFPGLFRGLLDANLRDFDEQSGIGASQALAALVADPQPESILPGVLDERVVPAVAGAVASG